jgi:hypothetical protein
MAPNELPPRPSLEQLRKRAKDLLKAARSEEAAAIARLQKQLSGHAARVQLADALNVIAREYGFPSWAKLKAYVETVRSTTVEVVQPPLVPAEIARRFRRRGPRQMPSRRYIQELHAAVVQAATENGMPFPFIFARRSARSRRPSNCHCARRWSRVVTIHSSWMCCSAVPKIGTRESGPSAHMPWIGSPMSVVHRSCSGWQRIPSPASAGLQSTHLPATTAN